MAEPIIYIDRSRIRPGKLSELRDAIDDLVRFIEAREPQLIHYGFYLDEVSSRMTVIAVHPDVASVELHMEIGGPAFRGFAELIEMEGIEVYGTTSDRMLRQLDDKVVMLGERGSVVVGDLHAGFARVDSTAE
jgi:hypothetical protein